MKLTYLETVQTDNNFDFYFGVKFDDFQAIEYPSVCATYDGKEFTNIDLLDAGILADGWYLTDEEQNQVISFIYDHQILW